MWNQKMESNVQLKAIYNSCTENGESMPNAIQRILRKRVALLVLVFLIIKP